MKCFKTVIKALFFARIAFGFGPIILFGPDISVEGEGRKSRALSEEFLGTELCVGDIVNTNSQKAYILFNDNQIIELSSNMTLCIKSQLNEIHIDSGAVILHFASPPDTSYFTVFTENTKIRYIGTDSVWIGVADSTVLFTQGGVLHKDTYLVENYKDWYSTSSENADYLFRLIEKGKLPATKFRFSFPSQRPAPFRHRTRNQGGIASYDGQSYYYLGLLYRVDIYRLRIVYNLWLAMSENGHFYSEAWDEWSDLIDNIHYIELFKPQDPFYLRAGLIENLTFGHGLLMDKYSNAIFPPFEKKSGLRATLNLKNTRSEFFVNDIGYPRLMGMYFRWDANKRFNVDFTFVGDFDQFIDIKDDDRDGYPDRIDPEPNVPNSPNDSIIQATQPQSIYDFDENSIYGVAFGMRYQFLRDRYFSGRITGEIAGLTNGSMGITFPNCVLGYRWLRMQAGVDLQTPRFSEGIFDRNYEERKARWIEDEDGGLVLVTRNLELEEAGGWLYGWNNGFSINVSDYFNFNTQFRDIYRDDSRDKRFYMSFDIDYAWWKYLTGFSFFIEQKNVSQIFRQKTDGQNWGLSLEIEPHHTITLKLRYRERYNDINRDDIISGSSEIKRNFDGNASIDGSYWWKKFRKWWKARKAVSHQTETAVLPD